jgi:hypothetical protein
MSEKRSHHKMTGIDVYICINNTDEKYLTIGRPYRVIAIIRDYLFNQYYYIKNNMGEERYYPMWRFKPRNSEDDRVRGRERNDE